MRGGMLDFHVTESNAMHSILQQYLEISPDAPAGQIPSSKEGDPLCVPRRIFQDPCPFLLPPAIRDVRLAVQFL